MFAERIDGMSSRVFDVIAPLSTITPELARIVVTPLQFPYGPVVPLDPGWVGDTTGRPLPLSPFERVAVSTPSERVRE